MKNVLENIYVWWKFEARYYHKNFINGVKNLIRWFPTIWKDRDWDSHYIWVIMIKKIKNQSKYIGDNDRHRSAKRDSEIMMTCVRLMEKVKDEYYSSEFMDHHESDYNWVDSDIVGYKQLEIVEKWENYDKYFKKYPLVYKKILKEHPNEEKKKIALLIGYENHKRARKTLFKLMERNIERWWD